MLIKISKIEAKKLYEQGQKVYTIPYGEDLKDAIYLGADENKLTVYCDETNCDKVVCFKRLNYFGEVK